MWYRSRFIKLEVEYFNLKANYKCMDEEISEIREELKRVNEWIKGREDDMEYDRLEGDL